MVDRDGQMPAVGHGVPRIDHQIQDHLFDLRRVGHDHRRWRELDDFELDLGADQPPEHHLHSADDVFERDETRARRLPAAEGEQLAREAGATLHGHLDFGGLASCRIVRRELHEHQIGRTENAHEDVVEVVRHTAGQSPDRLELQRLTKLLLDGASFGDVAHESGDQGWTSLPTRATDSSIGNSVPLARSAVVSIC